MHRYLKWRDILMLAPTPKAVEAVMKDYREVLPPDVVAFLPDECQMALGGGVDVQSAAVVLLRCEMTFNGEPEVAALLHEVAHTFAAASGRLTSLGRAASETVDD